MRKKITLAVFHKLFQRGYFAVIYFLRKFNSEDSLALGTLPSVAPSSDIFVYFLVFLFSLDV